MSVNCKKEDIKEQVIDFLKPNPCLWDTSNRQYNDKALRENLVETFGSQNGLEAVQVWKIIQNIKKESSHYRLKFDVNHKNGGAGVIMPTWKYWKRTQFLRDTMKRKKKITTSKYSRTSLVRLQTSNNLSGPQTASTINKHKLIMPRVELDSSTRTIISCSSQQQGTRGHQLPKTQSLSTQYQHFMACDILQQSTPHLQEKLSSIEKPVIEGEPEDICKDYGDSSATPHLPLTSSFPIERISVAKEKPIIKKRDIKKNESNAEKVQENTCLTNITSAVIRASAAIENATTKNSDALCSVGFYVSQSLKLFPNHIRYELEKKFLAMVSEYKVNFL